jgi:hypothetical protein
MVLSSRFIAAALVSMIGLPGCSTDLYRTQTDALQIHAQKFQSYLHREQVEAAMHENHAIELIGLQLKGGRLPGSDPLKPVDLDRQTRLLDAVREQSAVNWLALAQYFASRQQYGAARGLYQRVIQSYAKGGDRLYAEHAKQALADMDILVMGHVAPEVLVSSPALSALQDNRRP